MFFNKKGRIDELNTVLAISFATPPKGVCIALGKIPQHLQHSGVRQCAGEYLHVLHLARHYRLLHTVRFEERDHLAKLADVYPKDVVGDLIDLGICLFLYRNYRQFGSGAFGTFNNKKRELAVTGDKAVFHRARTVIIPPVRVHGMSYA